ncbi:putative spore protein YtfJ [bioreactor metagenome]|uniref:Putative spore protein YtfJ n=1 Tax=bioreactor metagenome TaxID=1076179 RepID=A0A645ANQ5_9ZZZZ
MSNEHPFSEIMTTMLSKIKEMVDVNTIIGEPIVTDSGVTIIPVSKVSFGFASGGSDFTKPSSQADMKSILGVGSGAGISINPIAFLVVNGQDVRLIPVSVKADTVDKLIDALPIAIDKVEMMIKKHKASKES